MKRKCSMRYLFVDMHHTAHICTQDMRRTKRVVTGHYEIKNVKGMNLQTLAYHNNCQVIIKHKGDSSVSI